MQCPSCGLVFDPNQQQSGHCPRCGYALTPVSGQGAPDDTAGNYPPQTPQYQPCPVYTPPAAPPPNASDAYNAYGYGAYAPPSGYGQPYGASAPPSYPMAPGYPQTSYPPPLAPLPERKRRTGLIVGITALVVVVLVACTGGALFALRALGQTAAPGSITLRSSATATASGTVIYQNTFTSDDMGWLDGPGHCFWKSDGYHVTYTWACYAPIGIQTDVDISVKVQQVGGPTNWPYGIIFRRVSLGNSYQFMIDSNGEWVLFKCVSNSCTKLVAYTANAAIHGGLNTSNTLEARIKGSHFEFFVNGTMVGTSDDTTYSSGKVGLVATKYVDSVFTDLVVTRPN